MSTTRARLYADGIRFGECPRWHNGRLWLSDFYDHAVKTVDSNGRVTTVLEVPGQPAGLGWLPDGQLLVVSMIDRRVLRWDGDRLVEHADLAPFAEFHANDMLVDRIGRAYVGNFGFDLEAALAARGVPSVVADHPTATLVRVDPDGAVRAVASGLSFPNGMALVSDRLLVAETIAFRVSSFAVGDDALADRRTFATLTPGPVGPRAPDGLCADAAGGVWFANSLAAECVRLDPNGQVTDVVEVGTKCFGCALGGDDGHTLFVVGAESEDSHLAAATRNSAVWAARVAIGAP